MKKASETILACLEERGISQRQFAAYIGERVQNLNQQLKRRNDMKLERFIDLLEYLGYRVEIVDNDGIRKVSPRFAQKIFMDREQKGLFWFYDNGTYTGIDNTRGEAYCEDFESKEACFEWLKLRHAI